MGVFDYITVRMPLEAPWAPDIVFQTKSMDSRMLDYLVTEEGMLQRRVPVHKWHEDSSSIFGGYAWEISSSWEDAIDVTCDLEIHTSIEKEWVSFTLEVVDGQVKNWRRT